MKKSSLTARLLKARQAVQAGSPERGAARDARGRGWKWGAAVLCIAATAAGSYALFHFVLLSKLPHPMLGRWVVTTGGEMEGAILEFRRDGTLVATVKMQDKAGKDVAGKVVATVEVDGESMRTTSRHPVTGAAYTDVQTIRTLTAGEFVFEDSKGAVIRMERPRE